MAHKKGRPGSAKGQPKPPKRRLDPAFPARLKQAMGSLTNAELARKAGVERATIGQWKAKKTSVNAPHLFLVADALDVSARWLLLGDAQPGRGRPLDREQHRVLDLHSDLEPPDRPPWINMAISLKQRYHGKES